MTGRGLDGHEEGACDEIKAGIGQYRDNASAAVALCWEEASERGPRLIVADGPLRTGVVEVHHEAEESYTRRLSDRP